MIRPRLARRRFIGRCAALNWALLGARPAHPRDDDGSIPIQFALIGDIPYNTAEESRLSAILQDISVNRMQFIVHVGDFKSGWESCTDELLAQRVAQLDRAEQPLILLPGDNDWIDCDRLTNGRFDPAERLAKLRQLYAGSADSLGRAKLKLTRQGRENPRYPYPENVRWQVGRVLFVGINVPGPNNGFGAGHDALAQSLLQANLDWLSSAIDLAAQQQLSALVIAMQGNPKFDRLRSLNSNDGYRALRRLFAQALERFNGSILLMHGDTHTFHADYPMANANVDPQYRFMRVECFGSPFASSWAAVTIDPRAKPIFTISPRHLGGQGAGRMVRP